MRAAKWTWPVMIVLSAVGIGLAVIQGWPAPARAALALWFLLICPGMAFVRLLQLDDKVREWTLAVALSLALDTGLALLMVYSRLWSPRLGLALLIGLSGLGALLQLVVSWRLPQAGYSLTD